MGFYGGGIGGRMELHVVGKKDAWNLAWSGEGGRMELRVVGKEDAWNFTLSGKGETYRILRGRGEDGRIAWRVFDKVRVKRRTICPRLAHP